MCLNHSEAIPTAQSVEKLSSTKLAPGAKKFGDHCSRSTGNGPSRVRVICITVGNDGALQCVRVICVTVGDDGALQCVRVIYVTVGDNGALQCVRVIYITGG